MKSANISSGQMQKVSAGWFLGMNSVRNPWQLREDQYKFGVNVTCRGGIVQTRPGNKMKLSLPPGNLQGAIFFSANKQWQAAATKTTNSGTSTTQTQILTPDNLPIIADHIDYILFVVSGLVYFAPFPLAQPKDWRQFQLSGISLDPTVSDVTLCISTRSASTSAAGDITVTPSYRMVIIQDGINEPAWWDGSDKIGAQSNVMPIGKWMAYSGNRLWVSNGNIVLASDLADPLGWKERTSGTGRGDFAFDRPVTGLVSHVGQNNDTRLIVFTDRVTYTLASGLLDRAQWGTTANFQNVLYPTLGCVAGKSIVFQAGMVWWYSQGGLVSADVAAASYLSSQVLYKDVEMARVKRFMGKDVSGVCAVAFENYILISVPYIEPLNGATMVLDYAAASEWSQQRTPAWAGIWTGTRPVEWITGVIDGQPLAFHISVDYSSTNDGSFNHLWESFSPERQDTYLQINADQTTQEFINRIYCQFESSLLGDGMDLKQLIYGELDAVQIGALVDVRASYRGGRGPYQQIMSRKLKSVTEDYQFADTPLQAQIEGYGVLRTQSRRLMTEEISRVLDGNSCESSLPANIDKAFSLLVEWCGEFGIDSMRIFMNPFSEKSTGTPSADETISCVVGEDGVNHPVALLASPLAETSIQSQGWTETASVTQELSCPGGGAAYSVHATATASYRSFVSAEDARTQAGIIARQAAMTEAQLYRTQNPCI